MLRMFGFLPPIAFYALAAGVLLGTFYTQTALETAAVEFDPKKVWLVGGILAFLLGFGGFQKSMENREKALQPRVSSTDVLKKLTPSETGNADSDLDVPPDSLHGPAADSPLGRVLARSETLEV